MIKTISINAAVSLVMSILVVTTYSLFIQSKQEFASIDLRQIMAMRMSSYKEQLDKGQAIPDGDAAKFADALESTLKLLRRETSVIILNSPAVISGVKDYTPVVIEMINVEMKSNETGKS